MEAEKHGFQPRPWEDNKGFTRRIERETRDSITHEMFKVILVFTSLEIDV